MNEASSPGTHSNAAYVFKLYVAGDAPNSVRALANLYAICREHFPECHRIEVIDVLIEPHRARADAILVTPTTVKMLPHPKQRIIGDLSEETEVFLALALPKKDGK